MAEHLKRTVAERVKVGAVPGNGQRLVCSPFRIDREAVAVIFGSLEHIIIQ